MTRESKSLIPLRDLIFFCIRIISIIIVLFFSVYAINSTLTDSIHFVEEHSLKQSFMPIAVLMFSKSYVNKDCIND